MGGMQPATTPAGGLEIKDEFYPNRPRDAISAPGNPKAYLMILPKKGEETAQNNDYFALTIISRLSFRFLGGANTPGFLPCLWAAARSSSAACP